jgi:hypothetical protein
VNNLKVYSNHITRTDVEKAFSAARVQNGADIWIEQIRTWKPRRETYGVEFTAYSQNGKHARNYGRAGRAASWSDHGYVIAHLFNIDPHAKIGFYDNEADFVEKVSKYQPRDADTDFLGVLDNIEEYGLGPACPACGSVEADCKPGCGAVPVSPSMATQLAHERASQHPWPQEH